MEAVGLGLLAGVLFGLLTVLVRRGIMRVPDPVAGSVVVIGLALAVVLAATVLTGQAGELADGRVAIAYLLIGLVAPGLSQIVFMLAVRDAGASRVALMIGTAPLLATIIAVGFRDEPLISMTVNYALIGSDAG